MGFEEGQRYFQLDASGNLPHQPNNYNTLLPRPPPPPASVAMAPRINHEAEQRKQITNLTKKNKRLEEENQALRKRHLDDRTANDQAVADLKQENEELRMRLETVKQLEKEVSSMKKIIKKRDSTVSELQGMITEKADTITEMDEAIVELKKRNTKLEKALAGMAIKLTVGDDSDMDVDIKQERT